MSLLDQPEAQALLDDAILTPEAVAGCADRLTGFLQRYLPHFYRREQRHNATLVIRGLLSGLERKTCEPIAIQAGLPRKGYGQELCLGILQAAGFSLMPSVKTVPLTTSTSSGEPFNDRQPFDADPISLNTIVRHAVRLPLPFVLS